MISSDVLLGSHNILDNSSWGPQKRFFGFSLGGYLEGGVMWSNSLLSSCIPYNNLRQLVSTICYLYIIQGFHS